MKLYRFHVAEGCNTGLQRDGRGNALGNRCVGGHSVEPSGTAAGDRGSFGNISDQFAGDQVAHDRAVTTRAVVNQSNRFGALMHRYLMSDRLIAHGKKHGVAGAVRNITGTTLVGAAEGALGDQAMSFVAFG